MSHKKVSPKDVVNALLKLWHKREPREQCPIPEWELKNIALRCREIYLDQPALIELEAPIKICGDIHGQFGDLMRLFDYGGDPETVNYLFLGDYIDRGKMGLETLCLLFGYKLMYPENFFMLRGNHECQSITKVYGFYDECKRRASVKLWKTLCDVFMCLPIAAIIEEKIICMHGGVSPDLRHLGQILNIRRPCDIPDEGLLCDLLWSDPEPGIKGWHDSDRGVSYIFGADVITKFLRKHDLDLVCRAHQVVQDGYEFFASKQLVTVFSAANYMGDFNNAAAIMSIDDKLLCSFKILKPPKSKNFKSRKTQAFF